MTDAERMLACEAIVLGLMRGDRKRASVFLAALESSARGATLREVFESHAIPPSTMRANLRVLRRCARILASRARAKTAQDGSGVEGQCG